MFLEWNSSMQHTQAIYVILDSANVTKLDDQQNCRTWTACLVFYAGSMAPPRCSDVWRAAEAPLMTADTAAGAAVAACSGTGWRTDPECSSDSHYTPLRIKHNRLHDTQIIKQNTWTHCCWCFVTPLIKTQTDATSHVRHASYCREVQVVFILISCEYGANRCKVLWMRK